MLLGSNTGGWLVMLWSISFKVLYFSWAAVRVHIRTVDYNVYSVPTYQFSQNVAIV
jgi:hypothetical protein